MKNHFFISYAGNKRNECDEIYKQLINKLDDVEYIIEPFCGTSAISYYISLKHPKKFKYILNDNNYHLIECYKIFQDDERLKLFINALNNLTENINKENYMKLIKEDTTEGWFIKHKICSIRAGLFPLNYKKKDFKFLLDVPIIQFLRNEDIQFMNIDATNLINDFKDNEKALILLDPPYLMALNDFYLKATTNVYEYIYDTNIKNMRCKILLVLENNWIIKLLFIDTIKHSYGKLYQPGKKKTTHLIISNF
jgi:site-specific DNA-adenine methylase